MRALVQRVLEAAVDVVDPGDGGIETVARTGPGLLVLVGVTHDDDEDDARRLAAKVAGLRVFDDDDGVPNLDVCETGGEVLVVSQFTLYGDTRKGRRPSWIAAARPEHAEPLVDLFVETLAAAGPEVRTGRFRTHMRVSCTNDGPVTVLLEIPAP